jgi:hypothetical protein
MTTNHANVEDLERMRQFGAYVEQQRIIEILEGQLSCSCPTPISHAIALIKGNK